MASLEPCKLHDLTGCADCAPRPPRLRGGRARYGAGRDEGPGPWFAAQYPGVCSFGLHDIDEGDEIRADGEGGWECRECAE